MTHAAHTRPTHRLAGWLAGLCLALTAAPALAELLSFGLLGDVYMTREHEGYLKGMLDDMADKNESLAIFTGGIKSAEQGCQDSTLLAAYPVFAKAPLPTFYVPGDADWLLCAKFAPEERLNLLRKTYYQSDRSLGDPSLPLSRQAAHPELMRWESGPALFVTLSVTGSNNHRGDNEDASSEFTERSTANLAWLSAAFAKAVESQISMLVIVMYGDPEFAQPGVSEPSRGYVSLLDLLKTETATFPGQVLLVHGGGGVHRIDHPLINPANNLPYQNFTRVETYGALQQGWVEVRIERNDKAGNDPVRRTEFKFESFPWPPLSLDNMPPAEPAPKEPTTLPLPPESGTPSVAAAPGK